MNDFRKFLQAIILLFLPRPRKLPTFSRRVIDQPLKIKPDEFLIEGNKPFRFSRDGMKRPIEKRER